MTDKIISNWQKKNHQLSQLMIDSLEGLDLWDTILVLGKYGKESYERNNIYPILHNI